LKHFTRRVLGTGMALVLASAAVACSSGGGSSVVEGSWDEVLAAAKSEGSVMLYSAQHCVGSEVSRDHVGVRTRNRR
jgi:iron(III) transport system substrate-binding protein